VNGAKRMLTFDKIYLERARQQREAKKSVNYILIYLLTSLSMPVIILA